MGTAGLERGPAGAAGKTPGGPPVAQGSQGRLSISPKAGSPQQHEWPGVSAQHRATPKTKIRLCVLQKYSAESRTISGKKCVRWLPARSSQGGAESHTSGPHTLLFWENQMLPTGGCLAEGGVAWFHGTLACQRMFAHRGGRGTLPSMHSSPGPSFRAQVREASTPRGSALLFTGLRPQGAASSHLSNGDRWVTGFCAVRMQRQCRRQRSTRPHPLQRPNRCFVHMLLQDRPWAWLSRPLGSSQWPRT